jgi:3-dehydroquinate synthase
VDLPGGKNLVGAFHQPLGIYADLSLLGTLPDAELPEGLAEVVKSAVVADAGLFRRIEATVPALVARSSEALEPVVAATLRVKARIVARDEREAGPRAALNFGHTVGHALEVATEYGIKHGRAVAIGMGIEAGLARELAGFPERDLRRLASLLDALGSTGAGLGNRSGSRRS